MYRFETATLEAAMYMSGWLHHSSGQVPLVSICVVRVDRTGVFSRTGNLGLRLRVAVHFTLDASMDSGPRIEQSKVRMDV